MRSSIPLLHATASTAAPSSRACELRTIRGNRSERRIGSQPSALHFFTIRKLPANSRTVGSSHLNRCKAGLGGGTYDHEPPEALIQRARSDQAHAPFVGHSFV